LEIKRRNYRMGQREEAVTRHRADILAAAREVFSDAGYHGAGLEEVALRAGLSRKTVYYQFGSKLGLLDALATDLEASAELPGRTQAIMEQPAESGLPELFLEVCHFWERNQAFVRALNGLAAIDADARKVVAKHDLARRRRLAAFVARLSTRHELRDDYPEELAVDLLWLLSSFGSYDFLVQQGHLNLEAAASLLTDAATVLVKPRGK
jgi:AcrR family transcriptional regulator